MDELIVKRLRGEATDIETRRLDRWRTESSENDRAYVAFVSDWNMTGEPTAPAVGTAPELKKIMQEGDARRARGQVQAVGRAVLRSPSARYGLIAAAAAILILLTLPMDGPRVSSTQSLFPVESSSSPGDITTLGLSDGSVVRLMSETQVEFPSTVDHREVVLAGRAFFAVAADSIPFVVRTQLGEVTVHGTRFEIATTGDELRLVVVEGTVRLHGPAGAADVGPGQVAYLGRGSAPRVRDPGDVWSVLAWTHGLLIYESTPLSLVAEELSRHFGREVTILDEALSEVRITAWFEDESIEEVVSAVCLMASAPCEVDEAVVTIGRQTQG